MKPECEPRSAALRWPHCAPSGSDGHWPVAPCHLLNLEECSCGSAKLELLQVCLSLLKCKAAFARKWFCEVTVLKGQSRDTTLKVWIENANTGRRLTLCFCGNTFPKFAVPIKIPCMPPHAWIFFPPLNQCKKETQTQQQESSIHQLHCSHPSNHLIWHCDIATGRSDGSRNKKHSSLHCPLSDDGI